MSGGASAFGCTRTVRYWPGSASGVGGPSSIGTIRNDVIVVLSGRTSATRILRKPRRAGGRLVQELAEASLPALAQRGDAQRPLELVARLVGEVEQRVDLSDRQ